MCSKPQGSEQMYIRNNYLKDMHVTYCIKQLFYLMINVKSVPWKSPFR